MNLGITRDVIQETAAAAMTANSPSVVANPPRLRGLPPDRHPSGTTRPS